MNFASSKICPILDKMLPANGTGKLVKKWSNLILCKEDRGFMRNLKNGRRIMKIAPKSTTITVPFKKIWHHKPVHLSDWCWKITYVPTDNNSQWASQYQAWKKNILSVLWKKRFIIWTCQICRVSPLVQMVLEASYVAQSQQDCKASKFLSCIITSLGIFSYRQLNALNYAHSD